MLLYGCFLLLAVGNALDNGVGITPPMGYNTWNDYRCDIDADDIQRSADALVALNLTRLGYKYINVSPVNCT